MRCEMWDGMGHGAWSLLIIENVFLFAVRCLLSAAS
jgi:hypothetical protein